MGKRCHEEVLKCHARGTSVPQPAGTDHYIRRCFSSLFSTASECEKERREERKEREGKEEEERKRKGRGKEERKERKRKEK